MEADGLLGRNILKGARGGAMNAILCGVGHNLRKILARLRALLYLVAGASGAFVSDLIGLLEALNLQQIPSQSV